MKRAIPFSALALLALFLLTLFLASSAPAVLAAPASVTLAANFEFAATGGACNDWAQDCAAAHLIAQGNGVWRGEFNMPVALSDGQYKMALNDAWTESYAGNHTKNGNTTLVTPGPMAIRFYYDDKTHAVLDSVMDKIATVAGSFQDQLGCSGQWKPECVQTLMVDPDGDGVYMFETTSIAPGAYEFKVARDEGWTTSYPGSNVTFSVTRVGQQVRIFWDSSNNNVWVIAGHAHDNNVEWNGLAHNSRDLLYRTPGGAVPAGTPTLIRFRTFHDDVTSVTLRVWDVDANAQQQIPMSIVASDVSCYDPALANETCDIWEATLSPATPANLWYRFIIRDGTSIAYYADDTAALDGGRGQPTADAVDNSWALMFYDPSFKAPAWISDAIIYQIFPDRFRNGNKSNDPKTGDSRYDLPAVKVKWSELPEGYCRNYASSTSENCPWRFGAPAGLEGTKENAEGRDYFGGDIKGVIQKLGYLKSIGVNTIYFNPIFYAKSNHRYDTADYKQIDPYLGTLQDFRSLVKQAKAHKIRILLDGVFNHMSSDSADFDRYNHYALVGACESPVSSYRDWFTFVPPTASQPSPCKPTTAGGNDTFYVGWFGFDSIPVLNKTLGAVQNYFVKAHDSVSRYWLQQGAAGWRLDVMGDSSFPNGYWEAFRQVVKEEEGDAVIIGELWQKDSTLLRFLRGDRADTTMDYRLRDALLNWLAPQAFDSKGFPDSGNGVEMDAIANRLLSIREDYPDAAYFSLMNLIDSHDTERALWTLTPGDANPANREQNATNLAAGKLNLKMVTLAQFSLAGAPTVYYGDEAGMTGDTDPDDRRTFPWSDTGGNPDLDMTQHYKRLAQIRTNNPVLTDGDLRVLLTDEASRTLVFGRKTTQQAGIFIGSGHGGSFEIPVAGYIPDGTLFHTLYGVANTGKDVTVAGGVLHLDLAQKGALLLLTNKNVDLMPPAAPTGLTVTNVGDGLVSLSWNAVSGAVGYNAYESPVSGGGWIKINETLLQGSVLKVKLPQSTNVTSTGLKNAQEYYFVVRAVDALGNESGDSNQVSALPHLTIGWANLQWPFSITHTISAVNRTENIYGQVWIDGVTNQPGATPTLRAQVGYGLHGTNPATDPSWKWIDAAFNADKGNNDEFVASLLPDATGDFDYLYRYSTTNGTSWLYAQQEGPVPDGTIPTKPGRLTVNNGADTTPPAAPTGLLVTSSSPTDINLAWTAVSGDPTLYGYEVLRSNTAGGPYTILALVTATTYDDNTVAQGSTYYYVIRAVDQSYNRSGFSNEVQATANPRKVTVVFTATVPTDTDASGKSVHIAGSLSALDGGLPDWNPSATAGTLTRVDATHWTITLTGNEGVQIQYKYALGDWNWVEKDAGCGEISNRMLTLSYGATGTQNVNDTVLNWRNSKDWDAGGCGN